MSIVDTPNLVDDAVTVIRNAIPFQLRSIAQSFRTYTKLIFKEYERMIKGVVLFNIENTEQSTLLHEAIHLTFYLFKWQLIGIIFEKLFNIKTNNLYKHEEQIVSYIEELMNIFNSMIEEAKNKKEEE